MRALAGTIALGPLTAWAQASHRPGVEHGTIYYRQGVYAAFPTLTDLGDGRYATEFTTRTKASHIEPAGGSARYVTSDGGRSWQPYDGEIIRPMWKTADGRIVEATSDGWTIVPANEVPKGLPERGWGVQKLDGDRVSFLGGAHFRTSRDGGQTWETQQIPLPDDVARLMHYHADASQVTTSKGVRLSAVYGLRTGEKGGGSQVYLLRSADDGKTWQVVYMTPDGLPEGVKGMDETAIIELPGGEILAMSRTGSQDFLYRSVSRDQGLTWSTPEKTDIWGYPCDLLVLEDGRVLCVYGYRRKPMGVRACVSHDGGTTWDVKNEIVLRDDAKGRGADVGYPLVERTPDGMFLTVYYLTTEDGNRSPQIAWTRFALPAPGTAQTPKEAAAR